MNDFISICGHTYNVENTLPIVDGSVLKLKSDIVIAIRVLLDSVGYKFSSPNRSVPAFLLNYRVVDRKILIKTLKNLVHQLQNFPSRVLDICVLGPDGLSVVCPSSGKNDRICKLTLVCDLPNKHSETVYFAPLSQVSSYVDSFFSSPYSINHKIIIQ